MNEGLFMSICSVCIYCGSSLGNSSIYAEQASILAKTLAQNGITIIYGGAKVGVMGVIADTALAEGGKVIGVIPKSLVEKEIAHQGLSEIHIVESMHERKALMADLSDGFIALPGGAGTLEELSEVWTWAQLGFHSKPCGILNVSSYYGHLLAFISHASSEGFLRPQHKEMLIVANSADELLLRFNSYKPPKVKKWLTKNEI